MTERSDLDDLTVAAIGMVAYLLANVVHEGLGHGGMCLAVGGRAVALSSAWFEGDYTGVSAAGVRAVEAGGTVANLAAGALLLALLPFVPRRSGHFFYFVWLAMLVNLFQGGGYLLVSPLAGFGDGKAFLVGLPHPLAWKVSLTAIGLAIYAGTLVRGLRTIGPLLGPDPPGREWRARRLCLIPYVFAGGLAFPLAALLNPGGRAFVVTSAAAHLGGTAWLAWLPAWVRRPLPGTSAPPLSLARHVGWLVAGALALALCVLVLGPSIPFPRRG